MSYENESIKFPTEYGDKASRVIRVLMEPDKKKRQTSWYNIAKKAQTAYGWTHTILSRFQDKGLIKGTKIIEPESLFKIWLERPRHRKYREYHIKNSSGLLNEKNLPDHAITTYYAEELVGAYLFPRFLDIYIKDADASNWHELLASKGYVGKGNVRILLDDPHIFYSSRTVQNRKIVSIQQLILDLLVEGVECSEAADLLIKRYYHG